MELTPEELETVKVIRLPTTVITSNVLVDTTQEATVYVRCLDMFVTVQLLEDTPAVVSLGTPAKKLCTTMSELRSNTIVLLKKKKKILRKCDHQVIPTSLVQQVIQLKTPRS